MQSAALSWRERARKHKTGRIAQYDWSLDSSSYGSEWIFTATERMVMTQPIKNVVLVHGAFADGSGGEPAGSLLKRDGYTVSVAQPPETSYADDQKYTKAAIDAMDGPVVLVGHSYGGSI